MKSLRIAFVTSEYVTEKYFGGGLSNYIYRVSKALVTMGHEVHVITLSEIDTNSFSHDDIYVHRITLGSINNRLNRLTKNRIPNTSKAIDFSFQAYSKLNELNRQITFDIVQFPNYLSPGLISVLLLNIPIVVRMSSHSPTWNKSAGFTRNLDIKIIEWLEQAQIRLSKYIFAPSFALKHLLEQEVGINNVKVIRTPFFLETLDWDTTIYSSSLKDKSYFLFFGRFQLHKGFHILAQAVPYVLERHPDCYAVFVGLDMPSSLNQSMINYAKLLCVEHTKRLIFIDQIPHSKLYPIIAGARFIVLPSIVDNLPNACLEAMSLGKPVIGTFGTSLDELITDGITGFLIPANDVDALSQKICQVWQCPELDRIGYAAKCKIQEFLPEFTVQELLDYYVEVRKSFVKR